MTTFHAICLGIIQGITEFLPVSSSTHLMIFSELNGLPNNRHGFDIFLNLGTILSILIYYRLYIKNLIIGFIEFITNKHTENRSFFLILCLSNLPTIVVFGIAELFFDINFNSPFLLSASLIFFAIVLWLCDRKPETNKKITMKNGLLIGFAQLVSIIPGISRLGICFSMARYLKYSREESFRFSMLISIPPVVGACTIKLLKIFFGKLSIEDWSLVFIGCLFSFIFGLLSISIISNFLKKHSMFVIVIYRVIFGIFIVAYFKIF